MRKVRKHLSRGLKPELETFNEWRKKSIFLRYSGYFWFGVKKTLFSQRKRRERQILKGFYFEFLKKD